MKLKSVYKNINNDFTYSLYEKILQILKENYKFLNLNNQKKNTEEIIRNFKKEFSLRKKRDFEFKKKFGKK